MRTLATRVGNLNLWPATYFLSEVDLRAGPEPSMAPWPKRSFITIAHVTADTEGYLGLPPDQTVVVGTRIGV